MITCDHTIKLSAILKEGIVKSLLEDKKGNIVGVNLREKYTNHTVVSNILSLQHESYCHTQSFCIYL